VTGPALADRI